MPINLINQFAFDRFCKYKIAQIKHGIGQLFNLNSNKLRCAKSPRSSYPFHIGTYYIKWVPTSLTDSMLQEHAELELELMNWALVILMMLSMFASGLGKAKTTLQLFRSEAPL